MNRVYTAVGIVALLLHYSCASTGTLPPIEQHGAMREVLRMGKTQGRISLDKVALRRDAIAVGALEGLQGEVTIFDGTTWISRCQPDGKVVGHRCTTPVGKATLLTLSYVAAWIEVKISASEAEEGVETIVARHARQLGIDVTKPFAFVINGEFGRTEFHVINGACPIANPDGPPPGRIQLDSARGSIVGFHAADSAGVMTHHDSSVHAHVILEGEDRLSGHLERVRLHAGNRLRLPRRQE